MFEPLLTAQQVAKRLNVRVVTVYAAAATGRLPHVKVWSGRRRTLVRFKQDEIERVIRERSFPAIPPDAA